MLAANVQKILDRLEPDDVVLDIGGWARPLARADFVMDLMPYASRGMYGRAGPLPERFSERTWIRRDLCDREPYPFGDNEIDFVVCSHTLEDVRDPLWVCSEMTRIAKAGYIEVPSRLEEQSYGVEGPWVGRSHHRWLVDMGEGEVIFTFKSHMLHRRRNSHFPFRFDSKLSPEEKVQWMWWDGSFRFTERFFADPEEHDRYMSSFVEAEKKGRRIPSRTLGFARLVLDRSRLLSWGRPRRRRRASGLASPSRRPRREGS